MIMFRVQNSISLRSNHINNFFYNYLNVLENYKKISKLPVNFQYVLVYTISTGKISSI